jgi:hypothetical protein
MRDLNPIREAARLNAPSSVSDRDRPIYDYVPSAIPVGPKMANNNIASFRFPPVKNSNRL